MTPKGNSNEIECEIKTTIRNSNETKSCRVTLILPRLQKVLKTGRRKTVLSKDVT